MKFIIYNDAIIPGYNGIRGPIMTPREYDLHEVLNWIAFGVDVREVMPDGSYRRLKFNDKRLMEALDNHYCEVEAPVKAEIKKKVQEPKKKEYNKKKVEVQHVEVKKEEKVEPVKDNFNVEEPKIELPIDNLQKMDDK